MNLIILKLALPPLLILFTSLAVRRWGDAVGGWIVGLPLISGPIAVFLAVQHGNEFAASAANGSILGSSAQACFSLGYVAMAKRGWLPAIISATLAYAIVVSLLQKLSLTNWGYFALAVMVLTISARLIPYHDSIHSPVKTPWWDLPARMIIATTIVVTLTGIASIVGAQLAGTLACFPVLSTILCVFAHRMRGPDMATQVLRGMVLSLYGFITFFFIISVSIVKVGIFPAFLMASLSSLVIQTGALYIIWRVKS